MTGRVAAVTALTAVSLFATTTAWAAEGALDPTFGNGGRVTTSFGAGPAANTVAIDPQGRIVAAGTAAPSGNGRDMRDMALVRYLPNGAVDTSFSGDGIATFDFPGNGTEEWVKALAFDAQGGILAAGCEGFSSFPGGFLLCQDFALIRVGDDGALDTSFGPAGSNGFVTRDFFTGLDSATALGLDPQGRIVVSGTATVGGDTDFGVLRYDATGKPDMSFGTAGEVTIDFTPDGGDDDRANAMAIDGQGRIVLAGNSLTMSASDLALARLNVDGTRDATFGPAVSNGHDGEVTTHVGSGASVASGLAIDAQGRILAAGKAVAGGVGQFTVARYNADGSLDAAFADHGTVITPIGDDGSEATSVGVDSQGRIVVTGSADTATANDTDLALARYDANGGLDQTFGDGGTRRVPNGFGMAAVIDAQDRIVIADRLVEALVGESADSHFALARFVGDAVAPVPTIGSGPAEGAVTNDSTPTFELASSEAGGSFACGFDGLSDVCISPVTPGTPLNDGQHAFNLSATDRAGNTSAALSRTFTVDTKAPSIDITGKKKVKTHRKKARDTLHIETSETAELTCTVDQKKPEDCVAKFVTPKLKKGKHAVTVTATDQAGNSSDESKKIKVVLKP